jgi:hypothetical protein
MESTETKTMKEDVTLTEATEKLKQTKKTKKRNENKSQEEKRKPVKGCQFLHHFLFTVKITITLIH